MIFLFSLGLAALFALLLEKPLRAHPVPFYVGAAAIALAVMGTAWSGTALPDWAMNYLWPVLARGGLAGALFVVVMFTGAFPNASRPMKKLMPIRGQLSILASILTLGHNAAYGKTYFAALFTDPASLPLNQRLAAVCSLLMLAIMLPLFVTSFQFVRRKMRPKTWKRLQRWAYGFYALLAVHILLLTIPKALRGEAAYRLTVFVYGAVFLSYLVCRTIKAAARDMAVGWTQNIVILEAELPPQERAWYIRAVRRFGWSKAELQRQIDARAHKENALDCGCETCYTSDRAKNICKESRTGKSVVHQVRCHWRRRSRQPRLFPGPQNAGWVRDRLHRQNGPPDYVYRLHQPGHGSLYRHGRRRGRSAIPVCTPTTPSWLSKYLPG